MRRPERSVYYCIKIAVIFLQISHKKLKLARWIDIMKNRVLILYGKS